MARYDHLIEYEKEALKELEAIGTIIGRSPSVYEEIRRILGHVNITPTHIAMEGKVQKKEQVRPEGTPKGDMSWEAYVQFILKELGGKQKTKDVVEYAVKANPKEDHDLILSAVRGKLSKLYRTDVIGANASSNKSEGYQFYIKSDTTVANGHEKYNPPSF